MANPATPTDSRSHHPQLEMLTELTDGPHINATAPVTMSKPTALELTSEKCAMPSPTGSSYHSPPNNMPNVEEPDLATLPAGRLTTLTSIHTSLISDETDPTTPLPATPESLLKVEVPVATESTLPVTSGTAPAFERAPSPISFDNWGSRIDVAKDAHYKRARIFGKTRQTMRQRTCKMIVHASRGFQRSEYVPTKKTAPPLLKRRYSIDVITRDWKFGSTIDWQDKIGMQATAIIHKYDENEPVVQHEAAQLLPNPLRYYQFNMKAAYEPPHDDGIYLVLGDAVLENKNFNFMLDVGGNEAWMRDSGLNMSLEVLGRTTDCAYHHIAMANTNMSQIFLLAAQCGDAHEASYDLYRDRLRDKKWILVPINDGMGGNYGNGSHWSLVIVDRLHKTGFYYDSTGVNPLHLIEQLAHDASQGLLMILGEDVENWSWEPQEYSPNQWWDNRFVGDRGPCGPFVWKMASMMIENIKTYQSAGEEINCSLRLDRNFPHWFKSQFDSGRVRVEMRNLIAQFKIMENTARFTEEHDRAAVEHEDVVMSPELPTMFDSPQQPDPESSVENLVESEQEQDGGIKLEPCDRKDVCLVGEEDLSDTFFSDDTCTVLSEPPTKDIFFDDEEGMVTLRYGNGTPYLRPQEKQDEYRRNDSRNRSPSLPGSLKYEDWLVTNDRQVPPATSMRARPNTPEQTEDEDNVAIH